MADCRVFLDGGEYLITSPFGYRTHPKTGEKNKLHEGEDIVAKVWRPDVKIKPLASGYIAKILRDVQGYSEKAGETGGNYVVVEHSNGLESWYKHLRHGSIPEHLKVGMKVYANTFIGIMGTTGLSTGVHLHLEIGEWKDGKPKRYDPEPYLQGKILIPGHDEMEDDIMGYPILKDDEYVNNEMAKKDTDETKASITKLQQILAHKYGFRIAINGAWSDELLNAIKQYQAENGLTVDGRVGPATIKSLNRDLYAEIKELRKAPAPDPALQAKVAQLEKDNSQLLADRTALQTEKAQLTREKAEIAGNNAKLASDLDTANKKLATIRDAFNILKSV